MLKREGKNRDHNEGTTRNDSKKEVSASEYSRSQDYVRTHRGSTRPSMSPVEQEIANIDWRKPSEFTILPDGTKISVEKYKKKENFSNNEYYEAKSSQKDTPNKKKQNKKFRSFNEWEKEQQQQEKQSLEHKTKIKDEIESHLGHTKTKLELKRGTLESIKLQMTQLDEKKKLYAIELQSLTSHLKTEQENLNLNQTLLTQALDNERLLKEKLSREINNLNELRRTERSIKTEETNYDKEYNDIEDKITNYDKEIGQYQQKIENHQNNQKDNTTLSRKVELKELENSHIQEKEKLTTQLKKVQSEITLLEHNTSQIEINIQKIDKSIKKSEQLVKDLELLSNHPLLTDQNTLMKELNIFKESQKENSLETETLEKELLTLKSNLGTLATQCKLDQQSNILEIIEQAKDFRKNLEKVSDQYNYLISKHKKYCDTMSTLLGFNLGLVSPNHEVFSEHETLSQWTKIYNRFESKIQEKISQFEANLSERLEHDTGYNTNNIYLKALRDAFAKIIDTAKDPSKKKPTFEEQTRLELSSKLEEAIAHTPKELQKPHVIEKLKKGWTDTNNKISQLCNKLEKNNPNIHEIQEECESQIKYIDQKIIVGTDKYVTKDIKIKNQGGALLTELLDTIKIGNSEHTKLLSSISQLDENIKRTANSYESIKKSRLAYIEKDNVQILITSQKSHIESYKKEQLELQKQKDLNITYMNTKIKESNILNRDINSIEAKLSDVNLELGDILYKEKNDQQAITNYHNTIKDLESKKLTEINNKNRIKKSIEKTKNEFKSIQSKILVTEEETRKSQAALTKAEKTTSYLKAEADKIRKTIYKYTKQREIIITENNKFIDNDYKNVLKTLQDTNTEVISIQTEIKITEEKLSQINLEKMQIEQKSAITEITGALRKNPVAYWMHGGDDLNTSLTNIIRFSKLLKDDTITEVTDRNHINMLLNNLHKNLKSFFNNIDQKTDTFEIRKTLIRTNKELETIQNTLQFGGLYEPHQGSESKS
jgi:hypothetical protein